MDPRRFDQLTGSIAAASSRRAALKLLGAGALAAVAARVAPRTAEARRDDDRWLRERCERHDDCRRGAFCRDGRCKCRPGREACRGFCVPRGTCGAGTCLPAKRACSPGAVDPCCGESTCRGTLNGTAVCCGIREVHACAPGEASFCCSGVCLPSGRCG